MLKKLLIMMVVLSISYVATAVELPDDSGKITPAKMEKYHDESNFFRIGRGIVNLITCWVEVPRCMLYQNSNIPILGLAIGAGQGGLLTGGRAISGVADVLFLGFDYGLIFSKEFPDFVWQAQWLPPEKYAEEQQAEEEQEVKSGQDQI
jgi:hypothetical protein